MKTLANLNARSKALATSASGWAEKAHIHLVDCVAHFKEHGDTTAISVFFNLIPSSVRRSAVKTWAEFYGGMKFIPEAKSKSGKVRPAHFIRNKDVPFADIDLDAASNESPWELEPEPKFKAFDLRKAIEQAVKRAEKAGNDVEHAGEHNIPADMLEAVKAIIA